jgi:hypothetical protein
MMRPPSRLAAAILPALLAVTAASAQEEEQAPGIAVDIELVLAVDASLSMDLGEQLIQRQGYAAAFRDEGLIAAMTGGYHGRIAVTYFEWADEYAQRQTVPWTLIENEDDAHAFAAAIDRAPLGTVIGTSISSALRTSARLIEGNEYAGLKRVIDISGDGQNISGPPVRPIRDAVAELGIVINGLPLIIRPFEDGDLAAYYRANVIAGQGSFVIAVEDIETLASSIRQKLILEIAGEPIDPRDHAALAGGSSAGGGRR